MAATATSTCAAGLRLGGNLRRHRRRRSGEAAVRQALVHDAEARRDVADRVERAIVRDDLDDVARPRGRQPHAGAYGDAQVAPVAHADGGRAMDELRAVAGEQTRRVVTDHPPVPDGEEVGALTDAVDPEVIDHAGNV